ncbi:MULTISPECIES: hypothetical protein [Kribbella]|nr:MULTISPECIES: hypothetical protein [Kribbella]
MAVGKDQLVAEITNRRGDGAAVVPGSRYGLIGMKELLIHDTGLA